MEKITMNIKFLPLLLFSLLSGSFSVYSMEGSGSAEYVREELFIEWPTTKKMFRVDAKRDGKQLGYITYCIAYCIGGEDPVGYIGMLLVNNEEQRKGYGMGLLNTALEHMKGSQCHTVYLNSTEEAVSFYLDKFGFERYEYETEFSRGSLGIHMEKNLSGE
jgi:predicted N-acetyltransferase YhbS